jgi:hypothetical protein
MTWQNTRFRWRNDFASFSFRRRNRKSDLGGSGRQGLGPQKFGKTPESRKKLGSPHNTLKTLKTDKKIFGKIWEKMPLFWKNLAK